MDDRRSIDRGGDSSALLVCPDRELAAELVGLLGQELPQIKVIDWTAYPDLRELEQLASTTHPSLCFLDMETDRQQAFRVLAQRLGLPGRLPTVALLVEKDPDFILRCLRQGAGGFLLRPFSADQLRLALNKVLDHSPHAPEQAAPRGSIYCVIPAKGGCGATTISINLASQAKRAGNAKVLLADMDPLTSPVAFLLKLKSQYSFVDALTHSGQLDGDLWKALTTTYQGIDVLLAPESPADSSLETQDPRPLLEYARSNYGLIVLDTGWPFGAWNTRLAEISDEVLLVATNDIASLHSARMVAACLGEEGVDRSTIRLVVNQQRRHAGLDPQDIAKALHLPVFHLLPDDDQAIGAAQMNGRPAAADSRFAKSLAQLAARLGGYEAERPEERPRAGPLSLRSHLR